jgi:hypothetical protein
LYEADIVQPFVAIRSWVSEHRVGQNDATIRPSGPITSSISGSSGLRRCDVDHAVTRAKAERLHGPEALPGWG